jgi:hypothetical protein
MSAILMWGVNNTKDTNTQGCDAKEIISVPDWVQYEIEHPADEGGRNNQLIKVGPTILRCGGTADQLGEIFSKMHPDLPWSELNAVIQSSIRLAKLAHKEIATENIRHRRRLTNDAALALPRHIKKYSRTVPEAPKRTLQEQRRLFLTTMFEPQDVIWIGEVFQKTFLTLQDWLKRPAIFGCFVSHCTFKPGSRSRCNANVAKRKYLVAESDKLPHPEAMAVFCALEEEHGLTPRALVSSGNKSLHAWFDWPDEGEQEDWQAVLKGYQCDPANLRPSQPVRLPGIIRPDTDRPQELIIP